MKNSKNNLERQIKIPTRNPLKTKENQPIYTKSYQEDQENNQLINPDQPWNEPQQERK